MQRSRFLQALVSMFPLASMARQPQPQPKKRGFRVAAGEARYNGHMQLQGVNSNILDVKISGKDTDGALALFEQTSISPGRGTPLHVHYFQDESFYVIEGEYLFQVGDDRFTGKAGDTIFLPRNVPHAWTQISERGKLGLLFQPAGKMEEFFIAVSGLRHPPTAEEMSSLFMAADMKVVGPPLPPPPSAAPVNG